MASAARRRLAGGEVSDPPHPMATTAALIRAAGSKRLRFCGSLRNHGVLFGFCLDALEVPWRSHTDDRRPDSDGTPQLSVCNTHELTLHN
jgi:hypothetical protein